MGIHLGGVRRLLLSACIAACESEKIFMYLSCSVRICSSSFIASFIRLLDSNCASLDFCRLACIICTDMIIFVFLLFGLPFGLGLPWEFTLFELFSFVFLFV